MKKFFIAFALAVAGSFFNLEVVAQDKRVSCTLHVSVFKFKKPRTDCQRSFGLCVKAHWHIPDEAVLGLASCDFAISFEKQEPRVENGQVHAGIGMSGNKLWLVLPKEIQEMEEYKDEDLSFLPIEDKIVVYNQKKPLKVILPQKAPMREYEKYLVYEFDLND